MSLSDQQRSVAFRMVAGLLLSASALGLACLVQPFGPPSGSLGSRLQWLAVASFGPTVALALCIARLAAHRFHTPADLDGGGLSQGTGQARLLQALLQNTLEQLALALPVYAAWAVLAPARLLPTLLVAAALFLVGRALFFAGYARGAPGRALGFALTFYPNVLLLAGALVLAVRAGHR